MALHWTESTVATRIEQRFPGSHATVTVSSSPYLVRLAVFGTVANVHAHVTDVTDDGLRLDTVDVTAHDLKVNRGDLLHGKTRLESLSTATITARVSVAEVLRAYGLGDLAGLGGLASGVKGTVQSQGNQVQISFGPLSFTFTSTSLVPCVGSAADQRRRGGPLLHHPFRAARPAGRRRRGEPELATWGRAGVTGRIAREAQWAHGGT